MVTLCDSKWENENFTKKWKSELTETMKAHHLIMCKLAKKKKKDLN